MTCHVYFAFFFGTAIVFYWLFVLLRSKYIRSISFLKVILYIGLQLIIPVAVFYLITGHFADLTPDRPSRPSPMVMAGGITNPNSGEASYMRQPDVIITNIAMTLIQWVIRTQPG